MRKLIACLTLFVLSGALAQTPLELIAKVDSTMLVDYSRPLIESYATAMGGGLYHSANSHRFLGFDIGLRAMAIQIPTSAKTFRAHVSYLRYSYNPTKLMFDTIRVDTVIENAATLFGKRGVDSSWVPAESAIGMPPALPGGLDLDYMPFVLPQASVGLPIPGMELMVRYIPWPFQGTTVQFLGLGLQQELTALPGLASLPVDVALQGFYQSVDIGGALKSRTLGVNAHASKDLLVLTPYAGIGMDNTTMDFDYKFKFRGYHIEPGTPPQVVRDTVATEIPVKFKYTSDVNWRLTLGAAMRLGLMRVNVDYNRFLTGGYNSYTAGLAFGLR